MCKEVQRLLCVTTFLNDMEHRAVSLQQLSFLFTDNATSLCIARESVLTMTEAASAFFHKIMVLISLFDCFPRSKSSPCGVGHTITAEFGYVTVGGLHSGGHGKRCEETNIHSPM